MPLDTSIATGYKPIQLESPVNQMANVLQLQNALTQNALHQEQLRALQQTAEERNTLAAAFKGGITPENAGMLPLYGATGRETFKTYMAGLAEQRKGEAEQSKVLTDRIAQSRAGLEGVSTPEEFLAWHEANHRDPILSKFYAARGVTADMGRQRVMQAVANGTFPQLLQESKIGAEKALELMKPVAVAAGATLTTPQGKQIFTAPAQQTDFERELTAWRGLPEGPEKAIAWQRLQKLATHPPVQPPSVTYLMTDQGLVSLPSRMPPGSSTAGTGAGAATAGGITTAPVTAQEVTTAEGKPIGPKLKDIPASINTAIIKNNQTLGVVKNALDLLEGKTLTSQVGGESIKTQGDPNATGWKGYLPGAVLNRVDPTGVDTRAAVANIGSMVMHDRSGAAVTLSEFPRLAPFIPAATDDPDTAKKKLRQLFKMMQEEQIGLKSTYTKEQGYKPSPVLEGAATPAAAPAGGGWAVVK